MTFCPPPAAPPGAPPPFPLVDTLEAVPLAALALALSGGIAFLRASLRLAHIPRVLACARSERKQRRLAALLERAGGLMTSAAVLELTCDLLFLSLLLSALGADGGPGWADILLALVIAVPLLLLGAELVPLALARRFGDGALARCLPWFYWVQLPLSAVVAALDALQRAILRAAKVPDEHPSVRQIVAGLRAMINSSGRSGDLDETERELIGNLMEFRDVDVAAVMTPRTEIDGVEVNEGMNAVIAVAAEKGHSRIPVYEGSLDQVLGYVSARGLVNLFATGELASAKLRDHLQPAKFVPETKRVSELLAEFRRERQKLAIVVDEYGGTAGLVSLGDVLEEIVGEIPDEFDEESPEPLRHTEPGVAVVDAGLHVSEVNQELGLDLPEEADFETLGGFVLAELGHFPKRGESFESDGVRFEVLDASDRRVISVRIRTPQAELSA